MCPWPGPHAPSFGRQLWGLPNRVEYLSPQGVLLPLVYGTTSSPLWLELRGLSAWQATPSWTVYRLACQRLLPWLRVTFAMVPDAAWPGSDHRPWGPAPAACLVGRLGSPSAPDQWGVGSFLSLGRPTCARVCGVFGHLAPVHRFAHLVRCFAWLVSWATLLLFTGAPARCVVLLVRCPRPLGSCSPVCPLGALLCVCGLLGHLAPVHKCVRSVCCFACAASWATWLLSTVVPARCVILLVRRPGPLGSCSPLCLLGVLPVCAVSLATWLLFTGVPARRVVLRVRCPGPLGSCSPLLPPGVVCCVCGLLGHLAPVHRYARSVCCCVVRCLGPLCSCSLVCPHGALLCVCGVPGHLAPVHRRACLVRCFACAVSWATWLLFTGVPARRVLLRVRCPGTLGSCSAGCLLGALLCVCGGLGHLAPVHRCARSVCCFACAVSWATWLLFTGAPALCVVLLVRFPRPLGSCSPVCPLGALPVCAVSWATRLLFTGVPAWCVVLLVRCPGPFGSCSPVCLLGVLCCVCGVLGHFAPVYRCARSVCCVACAVSWAPWLLFIGALA